MVDPGVVVVVLVSARLVHALAALWRRPALERAWASALTAVVRAAGPDRAVEVSRADGDTVTVRPAAASGFRGGADGSTGADPVPLAAGAGAGAGAGVGARADCGGGTGADGRDRP